MTPNIHSVEDVTNLWQIWTPLLRFKQGTSILFGDQDMNSASLLYIE
jgi:hypothetical protein